MNSKIINLVTGVEEDVKRIQKPKWEDFKSIIFSECQPASYRLQVAKKDGAPHIGICRFWWQPDIQKYIPTKTQINMPLDVWCQFLKAVQYASDACKELQFEKDINEDIAALIKDGIFEFSFISVNLK